MALLTVNGWILHVIFIPCSSVPLLSVGPCLRLTLIFHPCLPHPSNLWPFSYSQSLCCCCLLIIWKCVPLLDLLLCTGRNGIPPTLNTLHFGCSYCPHLRSLFSFHFGCGYAVVKCNLLNSTLHTYFSSQVNFHS